MLLHSFTSYFSGYYVLNALLCLSYVWLRSAHSDQKVHIESYFVQHSTDFTTWELQVLFTCAGTGILRSLRARSTEAAMSSALAFIQLFIILMAMGASNIMLVYYLLAVLVINLLFPQPAYDGQDKAARLTPLTLQEEVLSATPSSQWVVTLHADCSAGCAQMKRVLAEIANQYSSDVLKFGKLDVGEWPKVAKKFKIDVSTVSQQLPTVIVFENGQEKMRLPRQPTGSNNFTKKDIVKYFDLDTRATTKPATGSKK